jgi:uncharacterized protein involved in outer membrane biogenesis
LRLLLKIALGLVVVVVLALGGVYFALSRIDLAQYQHLANSRIAAATGGHVVHIDGELRVAPSLRPTVVAERVRFTDAEGKGELELARAARIEAEIEFLPLLRGEVRLARLIVQQPRIVVTTDAQGKSNWDFGAAGATAPAPTTPEPTVTSPGPLAAIGDIFLENGEIEYRPYNAPAHTVQVRRATLRGGELGDVLRFETDLRWQDQTIRVEAQTGTLNEVLTDWRNLPLKGRVAAYGGTIDVNGRLVNGILDADIAVAVTDLAPLKQRLGKNFGGPSGPATFSAHVRGDANDINLENLAARLGTSDLAGSVRVVRSGPRPKVTADIRSTRFDMADLGVATDPPPPTPSRPANAGPPPTRVIPEAPIDLKALHFADAEVRAVAATLRVPMFEFKDSAATATLVNGVLDLNVSKAGLAGGEFNFTLNVDDTGERPSLKGKIAGNDFPIGFFVRGKYGNAIEGLVSVDAELAGVGRSPAEVASSLDGYVQLLMGEGRADVRGLETLIGGIGTALGTLFSGPSDDWTTVNCSALRFAVKDGMATGEVILFDSRFATVGGEGTVNLATEELDLIITPKSKAAVSLNISVPVRITGTFLNPSFNADAGAVARRLLGVAGIFIFPPAAVAGLVSLGGNRNACVDIVAQIDAQAAPPGPLAPAPGAPTPAPPAGATPPPALERALENLNQGIRDLFGR